MRRHLLILGITLVVIVLILLAGGFFDRPGSRYFTMGFAGFKDHDGRMEALFWTTNGSIAAVNQIQRVSRKIGGVWTKETLGSMSVHEQIPYDDSFDVFDAPHVVELIGIPVNDLSSPLRVVFYCRERSPGLAGMRDRVYNYYLNGIKHRSVVVFRGRAYYVTNEVPVITP
jgi:hypothetical protein